jgi:glycerate dehydrogenase
MSGRHDRKIIDGSCMNVKPLKIVILDGYTANPGDLEWSPIAELGECTIYSRTPVEQISERIQGAEVVLTNKVKLDRAILDSAHSLRYIGVMATGYNMIDVTAAVDKDIVVTNIPSYSTASIAQATIAFLLELANHVGHHDGTVRSGRWSSGADFCYWDKPIIELKGMKLGIVGFGNIGMAVAKIAAALGMSILVYSRSRREPPFDLEVQHCDLASLLKQADAVSLHCPLNSSTTGLINRETLGLMKKSAMLLNTARGGLIVEKDLADALNSGVIAAAALDVLSTEPPDAANPLLTAKNCIITPHNGWASMATRRRLIEQTAANLRAYLSKQPINVVRA